MTLTARMSPAGQRLLAEVDRIGREVAGPAAASVDAESRFPSETIEALREHGLLAALVPAERGGGGCTYADLAVMCTTLGRYCGSSAMVFAMHQIQVACLVEHCQGIPHFDRLMSEIVSRGRLLASATTEAGIGGDVRSSICAVEYDGDRFTLRKDAPVISYGDHVDDILVTARRDADAAASDQVILHVQRPDLQLQRTSEWNAMGMRGTCSVGYLLEASGSREQIVPTSYSELSMNTMLPVTHILWASLWLGIAEDAMQRAGTFVRALARKNPGVVPPAAVNLADAHMQLERVRATLESAVTAFEEARDDVNIRSSMAFALRMNDLKATVSADVVALVQAALYICGIAGYRTDTPYSLDRHLRDAHSAALMVHNDRIRQHNASLLCVAKDA